MPTPSTPPPRTPPQRELQSALQRCLMPAERILWQGQPIAGRQKSAFLIYLFAIPWTVFALFWESAALMPWFASTHTPSMIRYGIGIVFPIFGLPFIAIGFWMLWKPFQLMRQSGQMLVALTDKRLIKLIVGAQSQSESVMLDQIGPVSCRAAKDGVGDLSIQTHSRIDSDGDRVTEKFIVTGVAQVRELERLLLAQAG
jgi:hypothetical protein